MHASSRTLKVFALLYSSITFHQERAPGSRQCSLTAGSRDHELPSQTPSSPEALGAGTCSGRSYWGYFTGHPLQGPAPSTKATADWTRHRT